MKQKEMLREQMDYLFRTFFLFSAISFSPNRKLSVAFLQGPMVQLDSLV